MCGSGESRSTQTGDERMAEVVRTDSAAGTGPCSRQHWLSSWGMVLWAAAATWKLSDPFPTGIFLRIPEDHKTIQGKTCCTALVLIIFCLLFLHLRLSTLSLLGFFGNRKTIYFRQLLFALTSIMKIISEMSSNTFFLGTLSRNLLSPFAL